MVTATRPGARCPSYNCTSCVGGVSIYQVWREAPINYQRTSGRVCPPPIIAFGVRLLRTVASQILPRSYSQDCRQCRICLGGSYFPRFLSSECLLRRQGLQELLAGCGYF